MGSLSTIISLLPTLMREVAEVPLAPVASSIIDRKLNRVTFPALPPPKKRQRHKRLRPARAGEGGQSGGEQQ